MSTDLEDMRKKINDLDANLVDIIDERMNLVEDIATYKKEKGIDMIQEEREKEIINEFEKMFAKRELPPNRGRELANLLIKTSLDLEEEIIKD